MHTSNILDTRPSIPSSGTRMRRTVLLIVNYEMQVEAYSSGCYALSLTHRYDISRF